MFVILVVVHLLFLCLWLFYVVKLILLKSNQQSFKEVASDQKRDLSKTLEKGTELVSENNEKGTQ
jgi:hypothetical protein